MQNRHTTYHSHENKVSEKKIILPNLPKAGQDNQFELEVFSHFIGHLRQVPNSRLEIKILSSIHFTADMLDTSDALISKTLVDLGLRAPRKAFPISFLDFVDRTMARQVWDYSSPAPSVLALKQHWDLIGEDRFSSSLQQSYSVYHEQAYINA